MTPKKITFDSICVHDLDNAYITKPHQLPIYATSAFEFDSLEESTAVFTGQAPGHVYSRYGNPTVDAVAKKIAKLESLDTDVDAFGLMTSSGMAAISTMITGLFQSGDSILTQNNLYGGTTQLLNEIFTKQGIDIISTDLGNMEVVQTMLNQHKKIKGIYIESPTNPTLACIDLKKLSQLVKPTGIITMIDNTFATPYLQQPLALGIDLVIHSTTKYLNGHGNAVSGIIIGDKKYYNKIWSALKLLGTNGNPFDAWLVNNGIKTLSLRMDRHCQNAMNLAKYLDKHEKVKHVNYIGLETHPDHLIAAKQMRNFGGMLSFTLNGNYEDTLEFMRKITFCKIAPTLGNVDTLIVHPASMSHAGVAKDIRERIGISDSLVRISVGIEGYEDIENDIATALG